MALKHRVTRKVSDWSKRAERYLGSRSNVKERHNNTYNLHIKLKRELLKKRVWDQIIDSSSPLGFLSLILEIDTCLAAGSDKYAYFHTTHILVHLNTKLKLIVNSECTYSTETVFCIKK